MKIVSKLLFIPLITTCLPFFLWAQGDSSNRNETNKLNVISFNKYLPNAVVDKGLFTITSVEDDIFCTKLTDNYKRKKQHYMIENCFDQSDIKTVNNKSSVSRTSGILTFIAKSRESGNFTFEKDSDFVNFLEREGVELNNDLYYFKLFLGDIEEDYLLGIKKLGYQPTIVELGRLVWHDASLQYIEGMRSLMPEMTLNDISMLSSHDIPVSYIKKLISSGVKNIDFHKVKKRWIEK